MSTPKTRRAMELSGSKVAVAMIAGVVIIAMVAMITYQLDHPMRPMGLYPTTMGDQRPTTNDQQPTTNPGLSRDEGDQSEAATKLPPTPSTQRPPPDPRYDRRLSTAVLGGFGKRPRDLDVGGRRFTLLHCEAWDCQIELDDGALVWVGALEAGERAPSPTAVVPTQPPAPPPTVCATARGLSGEATICGYGYDALLAQAQAQAGQPIPTQPESAGADAFSTQSALLDQTAYTVQTEQAHIIETQTAIATP